MRITLAFLVLLTFSVVFADRISDSAQVMQWAKEASAYKKQGELIKCIESVKKAIELGESIDLDPSFVTGRLKNYLANRYSNIGDFDRAVELNLIVKAFYLKTEDYNRYVWSFNNLGINHFNQGQYVDAKKHFSDGYNFANKLNLVSEQIDLLDGLVLCSIRLKDYDAAQHYLKREKELLQSSKGEDADIQKVYYAYAKADYHKALGQKKEAAKWYEKSIAKAKELDDRKLVNGAVDLAELYFSLGQNEKAADRIKDVFKFYDIVNKPLVKDPYLLQAYFINAKILLKESKPEQALKMVQKAEEQASYFHAKYMFAQSKFFLDDYRRKNLELGVKANVLLWQSTQDKTYLNDAILMADQAKSNVLKERLVNAQRLKTDEITNEDASLRLELIYQLNELELKEDFVNSSKVRDRLDSLNSKLGFRDLGSDFELSDLQNVLSPSQAVIQYFFVDSICYRFVITQERIEAKSIGVVSSEKIIEFYSMATNANSDATVFSSTGLDLYADLIGSLSLKKEVNELVIVPDGLLSLVPFGALPSNHSNSWSNLSYLQQDYILSYGFSLLSLSQQSIAKNAKNYVGFAPDFSEIRTLSYLKNGEQIISEAISIFGGDAYLGADATTAKLMMNGMDCDILQLYTHAVSSDSSYNSSYIHFQDRKMYVDEIMSLPLQTNLCLLTACEVGLGKNYSGEGVTGVAWAFRAGGAQNVVQSIWKLNEQSTATISKSFLENISNGEMSTNALSRANMEYLNNPEISARLKHPYYWAGMSHYGLGTAKDTGSSLWLGLLVVTLATLTFVFIRKFVKR